MPEKFTDFPNRLIHKHLPDNILLLLIFTFPILSMSVRHWLSGIYSLLALFAAILFFTRRHESLRYEEKVLFLLVFLYLLSFFFSATLNDWSDNSFRRLGNVMKYLFFFPLYMLLRQYNSAHQLLFYGIVIGAAVLGLQSLYEILILDKGTADGIYGPIVFGDLAVLFSSVVLILILFKKHDPRLTYLYVTALSLGVLTIYLSGSRNAWLTAAICIFLIFAFSFKFLQHKKIIAITFSTLCLASLASVLLSDQIQIRYHRATAEFTDYISTGAPHDVPLKHNSVGFRLESWRAALEVYKDAPWFGFGGGNAGKYISRYAEQGHTHPDFINPDTEKGIGGLHSTYFESLLNEGITGLLIILAFLFYLIYFFFRARSHNPVLSTTGLIFIINYLLFGTTENPFVHDNFTSVFLIFLAVLFSATIRSKYQKPSRQNE